MFSNDLGEWVPQALGGRSSLSGVYAKFEATWVPVHGIEPTMNGLEAHTPFQSPKKYDSNMSMAGGDLWVPISGSTVFVSTTRKGLAVAHFV